MTMRRVAAVLVIASIPMTLIGLALLGLTPTDAAPTGHRLGEVIAYLVLQVSLTAVAAVLVWRRPEHRLGWVISAGAWISGAQFLFAGYAVYGLYGGGLPYAHVAAWLYTWTGAGLGVVGGLIFLTFPSGRLGTRSARLALAAVLVGSASLAAVLALRPGPLGNLRTVINPFGWQDHGGLLDAVQIVALASVAGAIAIGVRRIAALTRSATSVERQQLKWFVWSGVIFAATFPLYAPFVFNAPDAGGSDDAPRYLARVAVATGMAMFPISIGIAILRYRLYDIDVLIRRTLVYASVSAVLLATYVVGVVLVGAALRPFTAGSDLAVAVSTLLVVALFQPIRRRVQHIVDRRFYRSRYDASRTLDAFSARLRNEVELDAVRADLLGAVGDTVRPAHASVWLRDRSA